MPNVLRHHLDFKGLKGMAFFVNISLPIHAAGQGVFVQNITCQQALRGTLAAGREKEGELGTTSLEFEYLHWEMLISGDDISNQNITLGSLLADYPECGMNVYLSIVHFPKQSSNREVVVVYLANVYINRFFFSPRSWNQLTTDKGKSGDSTKIVRLFFSQSN